MQLNKNNKSPSKLSPYKDPQFNKLKKQKKQLVKKLLYIFTYYAGKASRYACNQLQQKYYLELFSDVWQQAGKNIYDHQTGCQKNLQILYYSKGKKQCLDFNQFLDLLPSISVYFENELNRQDSLKSLLHYLLLIYQNKIYKELERKLIDFQDPISQETKQFVFKLVPDFVKIYKIYFSHQLNNRFPGKDYRSQSFQSVITFFKEFQVFPKLITTRQLFYLFNEICDKQPNQLLQQSDYNKHTIKQIGQTFRLSKFIQMIISVSRIALPKLKQIENIEEWQSRQKDILKILLEYMETIKSIKKTKSQFYRQRFSFIVYSQYIEQKPMKTLLVGDKMIKEPSQQLKFYNALDRIQF